MTLEKNSLGHWQSLKNSYLEAFDITLAETRWLDIVILKFNSYSNAFDKLSSKGFEDYRLPTLASQIADNFFIILSSILFTLSDY